MYRPRIRRGSTRPRRLLAATVIRADDPVFADTAEDARQRAEVRLRHALDGMRAWVWEWDLASDRYWHSEGWERLLGYEVGEIDGDAAALERLIHPDDLHHARREIIDHLLGRQARYESEHRLAGKDGRWRWVLDRGQIVATDHHARPLRLVGVRIDVTDRRSAAEQARRSEERLKNVLDALDEGVVAVAPDRSRGFANAAFERLFGAGATADRLPVCERGCSDAGPGQPERQPLERVLAGERFSGLAVRIRDPISDKTRHLVCNGAPVVTESGQLELAVLTVRDVSDHVEAARTADWAASHDRITGLINRSQFIVDAQELLPTIGAGLAALLLVDLDNFSRINDQLGHATGDIILRKLADRLPALVGNGVLARLGGDEFAIVTSISDRAGALEAAAAIRETIGQPLTLNDRSIELRASVGIALYPEDAGNVADLLAGADLALGAAKARGRNQALRFRPAFRRDFERRIVGLDLAREVLADDRVVPFYQPKIDLRTGYVVGFEALLRWIDGEGQPREPAALAQAFDESDLAAQLGDRIWERVIADMRAWNEEGLAFGHVAVNASAVELRDPGFADRILRRLAIAGLDPAVLELEVTENIFIGRGADHVEQTLEALSERGVRVALDDFGTGYACLSHLRELPVDVLKIDRSFISGIHIGGSDTAIASAIIALGRELGKQVVAEGVENETHVELLRRRGCDIGQGFWFGRPMPAADVVSFLAQAGGSDGSPAFNVPAPDAPGTER